MLFLTQNIVLRLLIVDLKGAWGNGISQHNRDGPIPIPSILAYAVMVSIQRKRYRSVSIHARAALHMHKVYVSTLSRENQ